MQKITLLLILSLGILLILVIPGYTASGGSEDFVKYWAASDLLSEGKNPYDSADIARVANAAWPGANFGTDDIIFTWNPPWLLVLFLPLTFLPYMLSVRLWIITSLGLLAFSGFMVWKMLGQEKDIRGYTLGLLAIFLYGNTIHMLRMGQITSLLLAALVACIWLIENKKDFWAGLLVMVLTIKFQIFYLVLLVIFFWVLRERRWGVIAGGTAGVILTTLLALIFYPDLIGSYIQNISQLHFSFLTTSTLGSFAYWVLGQAWVYWLFLLLLPLAWPLSGRTSSMGWIRVINLAIAASVPLSPYGYSFDHVVYIPAVLQLIAWLRSDALPGTWKIGLVAGLLAVAGTIYWMMSLSDLPYYWLALPALALSVIYILGSAVIGKGQRQQNQRTLS